MGKTATRTAAVGKKERNHRCEGKKTTIFLLPSIARLNSGLASIGEGIY